MDLYKIYDFCSTGIFVVVAHFFVLLMCCSGFYKSVIFNLLNDRFESLKAKTLCTSLVSLLISFVILFSTSQFIIMLGCKDIRVMPEGTYCYYVYATNEKGKTYTLPAKIIKRYEEYVEEDIDGNSHTRTSEVFYVENVYFKNGGYLYFETGDYFEYEEKCNYDDQNNREWEIELTNIKTFHEKVIETEPFKPWKLIIPFAEIVIIFISSLLYIIKICKE